MASDGPATGNLIEAAIDEVSYQPLRLRRHAGLLRRADLRRPAERVRPAAPAARSSCPGRSATSNCDNATLHYNVYRSTDPGFIPGPGSLLASGVTADQLDRLAARYRASPTATWCGPSTRVRERRATVQRSVALAPATPDLRPPAIRRAAGRGHRVGVRRGRAELGGGARELQRAGLVRDLP